MDQGKARLLLLICSGLLLAADRPQSLPLSEARWLAEGTPADRLLREPGECVAWPTAMPLWTSARIGRAAFEAPLLFGGQAARAGLSCASCHRNGRDNPDFHFPGISGAPGTADVTASLLSSHRGDGKFNPVRIPDLADPAQHKVARHLRSDLRDFIRGLVVEEFDGPEPPPAVLQGLVDYVSFMDPAECGDEAAIALGHALKDVEIALQHAEEEALAGDRATARVLLGAARSALGRIDERFSVPGLDGERLLLKNSGAELGVLQQALGDAVEQSIWQKWSDNWPARKELLLAAEPRSLYSATILQRQLANRD